MPTDDGFETDDGVETDGEPERAIDLETDGGVETSGESGTDLEWLVLDADETCRWRGGPRVQTVYPWLGLGTVGALVIGLAVWLDVLPPLAVLSIPVFVAPAVWTYARVRRTSFVVTTRRVASRRGVFGLTVRSVGLERVQNTRFSQHAIARLVGYGTVTIETASGADLRFWDVSDADAIRSELETQLQRVRERDSDDSSESPESLEQWEAVLAEVRAWRRAIDRSGSESN